MTEFFRRLNYSATPQVMRYCLNEQATVYSAANSTSPIVVVLQPRDEITVGGIVKNGSEEWHDVTLLDGKVGYISAKTKGFKVGSKPPPAKHSSGITGLNVVLGVIGLIVIFAAGYLFNISIGGLIILVLVLYAVAKLVQVLSRENPK